MLLLPPDIKRGVQILCLPQVLLQYTTAFACDMPKRVNIMEGLTVQGHVAAVRESVLYNNQVKDYRFPAGLGETTTTAQFVLCLPLLRKNYLIGVVVFSRTPYSTPFNAEEEKVKIVLH